MPTAKAFLRYDGVAFGAIGYAQLSAEEQKYLDENTVIFSNLFGPILGGDLIPCYIFKQGSKIGGFEIEKFYKENFSKALDSIGAELFVDLRAGFYDKFYEPKIPVFSFKFLKNGKIVSHWAKFYRGIVAREMAKNRVETKRDFLAMQVEGLRVLELQKTKNKTLIVCEIV